MDASDSLPAWAEHAAHAASLGHYVFPLLDKHVIPVRWGREATRSPEKIAVWARRFPEATGYGIALRQDQYVFDADTPAAVEWVRAHLPRTLEVGTGRAGGGVHFYFHVPHGRRLRMLNTKLGDALGAGVRGLDGKTKGGYVVGPGSIHKSGTEYRVLNAGEVRRPAALPGRIMKKIGDRPEYDVDTASDAGLTPDEARRFAANGAWGKPMFEAEGYTVSRQVCRNLIRFLRASDEGWADAFLAAGNQLGIYVANGVVEYEHCVGLLEGIFEQYDEWRVPGSNVPRSIRRGIAHGARREESSWL